MRHPQQKPQNLPTLQCPRFHELTSPHTKPLLITRRTHTSHTINTKRFSLIQPAALKRFSLIQPAGVKRISLIQPGGVKRISLIQPGGVKRICSLALGSAKRICSLALGSAKRICSLALGSAKRICFLALGRASGAQGAPPNFLEERHPRRALRSYLSAGVAQWCGKKKETPADKIFSFYRPPTSIPGPIQHPRHRHLSFERL